MVRSGEGRDIAVGPDRGPELGPGLGARHPPDRATPANRPARSRSGRSRRPGRGLARGLDPGHDHHGPGHEPDQGHGRELDRDLGREPHPDHGLEAGQGRNPDQGPGVVPDPVEDR